jgi:hypothetical protein
MSQLFGGLKSFEPEAPTVSTQEDLFVYGNNASDPQGHPEA